MKDVVVPYTTAEGRRRVAPASSIVSADRLIDIKRRAYAGGSKKVDDPVWEVLEEVIKVWMELRPKEYRSSVIDLTYTRGTLDDPEFGSAKSTKGTGDLRRTLDIPVFVELVMRRLFTLDELPFDKKWYTEVWKRVPQFRVSEKI